MRLALVVVAAVAASPMAARCEELPPSKPATELLRDASFSNGFILLSPKPGVESVSGTVRKPGGAEPVWQLAQWSSRFPFVETTAATSLEGGGLRLDNPARSVSFGGADGILTLAVNASIEYGDRPRKGSEPWVHLLVQQAVTNPPRLGDLAGLRLHVEARRVRSRLVHEAGFDSSLHAAQFLIFLAVQNQEKDTPDSGNFLWFGIPVFDTRGRMSETYAAQDFGGTGKFIYTPGSSRFTTGSIHDDGWVTFDADLLPLIREGLAVAHERGFLKESDGARHFRVAGCNMGWEVPGSYDVEMQVRRFGLGATPK